ncbi:MAG: pentapeptide repeat-containing protein [Methylocystis sp.]
MSDEAKARLRPANGNRWYCLATVYGEQEEGSGAFFDIRLAEQNRVAWNRWVSAVLLEEQRAMLISRGFEASELRPLSDEENTNFLQIFAKRTKLPPPHPGSPIIFHSVRFDHPVSFENFVFPTDANFNGAAFEHKSSFVMAAFIERAFFSMLTFSRDAEFRGTKFFTNACFDGSVFSGKAFFDNATFSGAIDFEASEFRSCTTFQFTKFLSHPPDFHDAELREATVWHDAQWPPPPDRQRDAQDQVDEYARLKAEMERLKKHEDEQFFFAKELRARRAWLRFKFRDGLRPVSVRTKCAFDWLLNGAYDVFGGYGLSVGSPTFWLVVLFAVGADIFALVPAYKGLPLAYDEAAGLSITNVISFLPYKPIKDIADGLSPFAKIIGDLQSLLGVILLFLLGLALRNRFRMK